MTHPIKAALAATTALVLSAGLAPALAQDTALRVFVGAEQRPDLMEKLFEMYEQQNPGVSVELETGGATSELQSNYLSTVLSAKDSAIDIMLIDVVNPAQYRAAGWLEPLNGHIEGDVGTFVSQYLPAYAQADVIEGELVALPAFADAMMLFYRTDLFEAAGVTPPTTWKGVQEAAAAIKGTEGNADIQGLSFQAKAIEGTVCTFLIPYWSQGGEIDAGSRQPLNAEYAVNSLNIWRDMVATGTSKANIAEVGTDDTRKEFQAGDVAMAVLWPYGWAHFQGPESQVAGKVGVATLPSVEGGDSVTCLGGWQWAVSAFSENKEAAADLIQFLAGPDASRFLAVEGSMLPTRSELYSDPEVLKANAWFEQALPVMETARARPTSPNYPRVSDAIRTRVNAVMAGAEEPEAAVQALQGDLARALR